ncbi:glycosyl transferase, WecB/TagA/CpsF family protein [Calothrix sp. NIES-2100]|uniref:WecB/TagA/CpsF family glycosyltransferase n=1 Tax=Calothrix sp. NIES-2100 TaxID=1954172 RepID=UPI000B5E64A8|nr:glycosyl transferase, WecB/TagA/CpsF family protein [Calothrix sp. NIES-2100]
MANLINYLNPRLEKVFYYRQIKLLIIRLLRQYASSKYQRFTKKVSLLNIEIDNLFKHEFLQTFQQGIVFTPNVDHVMKLQNDREFLQVYSSADYRLCDSQILIYASKFLGNPIKEKISGSDLFPAFYTFHKKNEQIKIFLLGAAKGVAAKAQEKINAKVRRNIIVGSHSPSFGFEKNEQECKNIVELINNSGATVLAVGLGAPKQEKWIYKYKEQLPNIKIFFAIGATIDFEAGNLKRAPEFISKLGLEWLYRMLCEPQRLWKRYLIEDLPFLWLILQQKLHFYQMTPSEEQSGK